MKSSKPLVIAATIVLISSMSNAAHVDFKDPKRALGREDDVRIDAQLTQDVISPSSPIGVTYQVQNLTDHAVAVADKVTDASYDVESQTITVSIGAEIPNDGVMPHLAIINPGEKRVFIGGTLCHVIMPGTRTPFTAVPRYVQIKVNVLRDLRSFEALIAKQAHAGVPVRLGDEQFERWIESNDAIFLNPIPVRWSNDRGKGTLPEASADNSHMF